MTEAGHQGPLGRRGFLSWEGPVVWWHPVDGWRHALSPELRPRPGQERATVCGEAVTLAEASDVDWLAPTCDTCMAEARARGNARAARDRARADRPVDQTRWSR